MSATGLGGARRVDAGDAEATPRWLAEHAHLMDPYAWASAPEALFRRKVVGEVALYLRILEHLGVDTRQGACAELRQHLLSLADERMIELAARSPERAAMFGLPLSYAARHGTLTSSQLARVRDLYESDYVWGFERPAHRMLELCFPCLDAGGVPPLAPGRLVDVSSLAAPPCVLSAPRDAFYALTHAAMYAALLGVGSHSRSVSALWLQTALCWTLDAGDLDLACELAVGGRLLGLAETPSQARLHRTLAAMRGSGMSVPPRGSLAVDRFLAARPEDALFARTYHTSMMADLVIRTTPWSAPPAEGEAEGAFTAACRAARAYDMAALAPAAEAFLDAVADRPEWGEVAAAIVRFLRRAYIPGRDCLGHYRDECRAAELGGPPSPPVVSLPSRLRPKVDLV